MIETQTSIFDIQLIVIIISVILSAWFAGSETVFLTFNKARLHAWYHSGKKSAKAVWYLTERPERYVSTVLVGNNLVNVLYSSLFAIYLASRGVSEEIILLATPIILLVVGEVAPKVIARQIADQSILIVGNILAVFRYILYPVTKPLEILVTFLTGSFNSSDSITESVLSRAEIVSLLRTIRDVGTLPKMSEDILLRILHLNDLCVEDIMTPRTSVTAINDESTLPDARKAILDSGHTRIPVYHGTIDNVIGLVAAQDLLHHTSDLMSVIRPMKTIPESMRVLKLLTWLKHNRVSLVGVIDEYGGLAGVVGLEDVTRELVGPTRDEYDKGYDGIVHMSGTTWLVRGYAKLSQVTLATGIDFGSVSARSIGGLITELAGSLPEAGDEYKLEQTALKVVSTRPNSVELVRVTIQNRQNQSEES